MKKLIVSFMISIVLVLCTNGIYAYAFTELSGDTEYHDQTTYTIIENNLNDIRFYDDSKNYYNIGTECIITDMHGMPLIINRKVDNASLAYQLPGDVKLYYDESKRSQVGDKYVTKEIYDCFPSYVAYIGLVSGDEIWFANESTNIGWNGWTARFSQIKASEKTIHINGVSTVRISNIIDESIIFTNKTPDIIDICTVSNNELRVTGLKAGRGVIEASVDGVSILGYISVDDIAVVHPFSVNIYDRLVLMDYIELDGVYEGAVNKNGVPDGIGKVTFEDNEIAVSIEGNFKNGEPDGFMFIYGKNSYYAEYSKGVFKRAKRNSDDENSIAILDGDALYVDNGDYQYTGHTQVSKFVGAKGVSIYDPLYSCVYGMGKGTWSLDEVAFVDNNRNKSFKSIKKKAISISNKELLKNASNCECSIRFMKNVAVENILETNRYDGYGNKYVVTRVDIMDGNVQWAIDFIGSTKINKGDRVDVYFTPVMYGAGNLSNTSEYCWGYYIKKHKK